MNCRNREKASWPGNLELDHRAARAHCSKSHCAFESINQVEKAWGEAGKVVELIENAVLAHFPQLTREELENMVQTLDLRQTKVFQEAKAEGKAEGKEKPAKKSPCAF